MCQICLLINKSVPSPKELARAYYETYKSIEPDHDEVIELKLDAALDEISTEVEFKNAYKDAFNDEVKQIVLERNTDLN